MINNQFNKFSSLFNSLKYSRFKIPKSSHNNSNRFNNRDTNSRISHQSNNNRCDSQDNNNRCNNRGNNNRCNSQGNNNQCNNKRSIRHNNSSNRLNKSPWKIQKRVTVIIKTNYKCRRYNTTISRKRTTEITEMS